MKKRRLWKRTAVIVAAAILTGAAHASLEPAIAYAITTQQQIDNTKDEMDKLEDQLDKTHDNIDSLEKKTNKLKKE